MGCFELQRLPYDQSIPVIVSLQSKAMKYLFNVLIHVDPSLIKTQIKMIK